MRAVRDILPKALIIVTASIVIVRVATAKPPSPGAPITEVQSRDLYRDVVSRERPSRRDAAVKFPGDPWSQDDDFHERENEAIRIFASLHRIRMSDAIRAVDDGMRGHWITRNEPNPKVAPCRPRLSY